MQHELFQTYFVFSICAAFISMMQVPSKMKGIDHIGGSAVLSIALGWLIWPFCIWAAIKARRNYGRKTH